MNKERQIKCELYNDNFQNYKRYGIQKAQLVIADIPYNIGNNFYGSNPMWYKGGDNKNGESKLAGKAAFNTDFNFNIAEYFHFCNRLLKKEPKERGKAPCMIVFCSFQQIQIVIEYAKKHGFKNHIPLVFVKNYSPQVLKANMRICGATEYGLILYRDKLPKFNNEGKMIFNWFEWKRDNAKQYPKIHPAQKPVSLLKRLIEIFTDEGDIVIDPVAGSGTTLRAARELNRNSYGFEVSKEFSNKAKELMLFENNEAKERSV
jgi:DNA methylase N-4/N-6 domain protein